MKIFRTLFIVTLTVVFASCSCVTATRTNGHKACKEMNDIAFQKVDISSFFKVKFSQADNYKVKVAISERFEPYLISEIKDGVLVIGIDNSEKIFRDINHGDTALVEISAPSFKEIELSGAVKMSLESNWQLEHAMVDLSGASKLYGGSIHAKSFSIEQSGASSFDVAIATENMNINNSGASKLKMKSFDQYIGSTLIVNVSGATKLDLKELPFEIVKVEASGASKTTVNPVKLLNADVSGASSVRYVDSSKDLQKNIETSGAASVSKL